MDTTYFEMKTGTTYVKLQQKQSVFSNIITNKAINQKTLLLKQIISIPQNAFQGENKQMTCKSNRQMLFCRKLSTTIKPTQQKDWTSFLISFLFFYLPCIFSLYIPAHAAKSWRLQFYHSNIPSAWNYWKEGMVTCGLYASSWNCQILTG